MKSTLKTAALALAAIAAISLPDYGQAASSANLLLTAPQVKEVSRLELDDELKNAGKPIVIQVYSSKQACQSCAQQREELIKVARIYRNKARFLRFDIEQDPGMVGTELSEPVHYFTKTGELTHTGTTVVTGAMNAQDLTKVVESMIEAE